MQSVDMEDNENENDYDYDPTTRLALVPGVLPWKPLRSCGWALSGLCLDSYVWTTKFVQMQPEDLSNYPCKW
jgi:hypothetical protein